MRLHDLIELLGGEDSAVRIVHTYGLAYPADIIIVRIHTAVTQSIRRTREGVYRQNISFDSQRIGDLRHSIVGICRRQSDLYRIRIVYSVRLLCVGIDRSGG